MTAKSSKVRGQRAQITLALIGMLIVAMVASDLLFGEQLETMVKVTSKTTFSETAMSSNDVHNHSLQASREFEDNTIIREEAAHPKRLESSIGSIIERMRNGDSWNKEEIPKRIPVVLFPYLLLGLNNSNSEVGHMEVSGVNGSSVLHMALDMLDMDPNTVWVGDVGYGYRKRYWCNAFHKWVLRAQERRANQSLPLQWPIFIVDYRDGTEKMQCPQIEAAVGPKNVRYAKRSVVQGRNWNSTTGWVDLGHKELQHRGLTYQSASYLVRNDIVQQLDHELKQRNLSLSDSIEELPRSLDVVHLWPNASDKRRVVVRFKSQLRGRTGSIIEHMGQTFTNITTFVGLSGNAKGAGFLGVAPAYIGTLLDAKIFLVVQRDAWEDHWRLFEAMVGGSMIMTDKMLSLPPGIINGTHLVEFTSEQDLRDKVLYYLGHADERLAIARQGREMAMSKHRAWHRMEEIIFGRPITDCSSEGAGTKCPYTVHAMER